MADYATLQGAIDAGITNMTVLRNHTKNDDSTVAYSTDIDWFKFNNVVVSTLYSSGNSWIGFGVSSEQLKVNRRDCAVWDEYKETGTIGSCKFFKFTWKGTSNYSSSYEHTDSYQQYYDVFLLDTGQIFLRFFKVPTSNCDGTKLLTCGSTSVSYSVSAGVPCEYTFTPSDATAGTGWSVSTDRPDISSSYKSSGNAIFTVSNFKKGGNDRIAWVATTPTGTSLRIYTKVNNGSYIAATNGGLIPGLPDGTCTLYVKAELATTDNTVTPTLSNIFLKSDADNKVLVLTTAIPNFSSVIGNMSVSYDGLGGLQGDGGPSTSFTGSFTPSGLTWKGHQNKEEHITVSMSASAQLTAITFHDVQEQEHVNISITAHSQLTDIHDI